MDINCTHSCRHQHEGKCTLRDLPAFEQSASTYTADGVDCPYYAQGNNTTITHGSHGSGFF